MRPPLSSLWPTIDVARRAGVLADDDRRAGHGVKGQGADGRADRQGGEIELEIHMRSPHKMLAAQRVAPLFPHFRAV
jgi:hypothetical protein